MVKKFALSVKNKFGCSGDSTELFVLLPTSPRPMLVVRYSGKITCDCTALVPCQQKVIVITFITIIMTIDITLSDKG